MILNLMTSTTPFLLESSDLAKLSSLAIRSSVMHQSESKKSLVIANKTNLDEDNDSLEDYKIINIKSAFYFSSSGTPQYHISSIKIIQ